MPLKDALLRQLCPLNQEHILTFWDNLDDRQRQKLAQQLDKIDFERLTHLFRHRFDPPSASLQASRAEEPNAFLLSDQREHIAPIDPTPYRKRNPILPAEAIAVGEEALRNGRVAAAVVAGGDATRLDFLHPKGIFPIGPISGNSLFQIHAERIRAIARKYSVRIPLCIQTSPTTHLETVDFFQKNSYFGFDPDDVLLFCQGTMPSVDLNNGQILLAEKDEIAVNPDGHGGFLAAINAPNPESRLETVAKEGVLTELAERGIDTIFYFQVDNPLIDICSPEFLGYHLRSGSQFSSQVIRKKAPLDKVGNIVVIDGKLQVIEYSDLPPEIGARRKDNGSLCIWAGSIAVHLFDVDFLRLSATQTDALPFHVARKKVSCLVLDPNQCDSTGKSSFGTKIKPNSPNAIKYEKFIFDLLPAAKNPILVEVDPDTCFEPLKNNSQSPTNNPETVRRHLLDLYRRWIRENNIQIADNVDIEISPLFANSAQELGAKLPQLGLTSGESVLDASAYWQEENTP